MAGRRLRVRDSDRPESRPCEPQPSVPRISVGGGPPDQRFHDLRHACATLRLEQGEELAVVSRILGHASITTTANVYGHLTDAMASRAAERTDAILGGRMAARG